MRFVPITADNRECVNTWIRKLWYSTTMVVRGREIDMTRVEGVMALDGDEFVGLVTFACCEDVCEILSLDSLRPGIGIGTALLNCVIDIARTRMCTRIILITTNDNTHAMRFYQKRGFDMVRIYRDAVRDARKIKPEIPLLGEDQIALRHEIEFVMMLAGEGEDAV